MSIIKLIIKEYNEMMAKYTKGTGGGPGADEDFATWEERDEYHCATYTSQPVNMYLSVVHIWDKLYDFPLHKMTAKGTLPVESAIDDFYNHDGSGIEDGMTTPASRGKSPSVRAEANMMKVLNTLDKADSTSSSLSRSVEATSREMLDIMRGLTNSPQQKHELKPHEIIGNISNNTQMIHQYEKILAGHKLSKRKIEDGNYVDDKKKDKKIRKINQKILAAKDMLKVLNQSLTYEQQQLHAATKKGLGKSMESDRNSSDDDSNSNGDSDSDSDSDSDK